MLYTEQNKASPAGQGYLPFLDLEFHNKLRWGDNVNKMVRKLNGDRFPVGDVRSSSTELYVSLTVLIIWNECSFCFYRWTAMVTFH